jgi:hypothetical protein
MKYRWTHCRVHLLLIMLIWLTGTAGSSLAAEQAVSGDLLVVSSSDNPFFRRSIRQLEQRLDGRAGTVTSLLSKDIEQYRESLSSAALIITLGARAMRQVSAMNLKRPLLHSYLTRYQFASDPPLAGSHSLLLDQPLQRYLRFDRLLTGARRIGILNPPMTAFDDETLRRIGQHEQIEITQRVLEAGHANPVAAVRQILQKTDNLLAIPAPDIYNRKTLKGILLAAYRLRKPVISYSPAHVRAGALGALYATPEQIGDQIAEISLAWLQGQPPAGAYSLARYFTIDINRQVAEALGMTLPDEQALLEAIAGGDQP